LICLLNEGKAGTELNQKDIDDAIDSVNNGIRELEDYLLYNIPRRAIVKTIVNWLRVKLEERLTSDPQGPFLADPQRAIVDLFSRVGNIGVRLAEVPDERERKKLEEQLKEVDDLLEKTSVTPDAANISWSRQTLRAIERRLPPSNQFWTMFAPILGVATLQIAIWWLAVWISASGPLNAQVVVGVAQGIFVGVIIAGTLGSLIKVIFRAIFLEYKQYRTYLGLYLVGLVRPIIGAVLALAVLLLFNSSWIEIPFPADDPPRLPDPLDRTPAFTAKEVFFLFGGFLAGFSDDWVLGLVGRVSAGSRGEQT
jgi:hypothetical protein